MTVFTSKRTLILILVAVVVIFIAFGVIGVRSLGGSLVRWGLTPSGEDAVADSVPETKNSAEVEGEEMSGKGKNVQDAEVQEVLGAGLNDSSATGDADFFINYRLERERVRGQQVELLQSVINDSNSDAAVRTQAQSKLLKISDSMDQELQLEALVKAKGFTEAALFVQQDSATAILKKDGMSDIEVSTVADIISQVTGHKLENIVVIPK